MKKILLLLFVGMITLGFMGCESDDATAANGGDVGTTLSNDATLSNLAPSDAAAFSTTFSADVFSYVSEGNDKYDAGVIATAANSGATITIDGVTVASSVPSAQKELNVGDNIFTIRGSSILTNNQALSKLQ